MGSSDRAATRLRRAIAALVLVGGVLLAAVRAAGWLPTIVELDDLHAPGSGPRPVDVLEDGADGRLVRHAAGVTRVPTHPERICALAAADELLSIGVEPIAHAINDGNFPDYLRDRLADVPWIPNVYGAHLPDLEAIVRVRPDLIITRTQSRKTYAQLSRIAPTVVLFDHMEHYRQRVLDVGAIIGRRAAAEARVAWYDAKVAAARAALHRAAPGQSVAVMRVRPKHYRLHGGDHNVDPVLYDDLGMARPRLVRDRGWSSTTSPEALLGLDADHIIISADLAPGSERTYAELFAHPIWARVPAVRAGRVLRISRYRHWSDSGILGKARAIDDVLRAIAPHALETVDATADAALRRSGG